MTKYVVSIKADQNDADYVTETNIIDFNKKAFEGWGEPYNKLQTTYRELFEAFGKALQELGTKYKNSNLRYNWQDDEYYSYKNEVLQYTLELLNISDVLDIDSLKEELNEFVPGTFDYPIHSILEIVAIPHEGSITFFNRVR